MARYPLCKLRIFYPLNHSQLVSLDVVVRDQDRACIYLSHVVSHHAHFQKSEINISVSDPILEASLGITL